MLIPFKSLHNLLSQYQLLKSLEGMIQDCYKSFDASIATAKELEDYRYLHHLITQREENEKKYVFFWDYRHNLPTVLLNNVDVSVEVLVKISFDHKRTMPQSCFIDLIENIGDREKMDKALIQKSIAKFNALYSSREKLYKLEHEKIQRNEPCPCGSGQKYKNCHGNKVVTPAAESK